MTQTLGYTTYSLGSMRSLSDIRIRLSPPFSLWVQRLSTDLRSRREKGHVFAGFSAIGTWGLASPRFRSSRTNVQLGLVQTACQSHFALR